MTDGTVLQIVFGIEIKTSVIITEDSQPINWNFMTGRVLSQSFGPRWTFYFDQQNQPK